MFLIICIVLDRLLSFLLMLGLVLLLLLLLLIVLVLLIWLDLAVFHGETPSSLDYTPAIEDCATTEGVKIPCIFLKL
jgi:hypothetical protein